MRDRQIGAFRLVCRTYIQQCHTDARTRPTHQAAGTSPMEMFTQAYEHTPQLVGFLMAAPTSARFGCAARRARACGVLSPPSAASRPPRGLTLPPTRSSATGGECSVASAPSLINVTGRGEGCRACGPGDAMEAEIFLRLRRPGGHPPDPPARSARQRHQHTVGWQTCWHSCCYPPGRADQRTVKALRYCRP